MTGESIEKTTTLSEKQLLSMQNTMQYILKSNDQSIVIIRGHIVIDNLLASLLDGYLCGGLRPFNKPSFARKVCLAYAVGLINEAERTLFNDLNNLRNRIGHRLDAQPSDSDERQLSKRLGSIVPPILEYRGVSIYQAFIVILFAILLLRIEDASGQRPPIVREEQDDAYRNRVMTMMIFPVLLGLDPESTGQLIAIVAAAVIGGALTKTGGAKDLRRRHNAEQPFDEDVRDSD